MRAGKVSPSLVKLYLFSLYFFPYWKDIPRRSQIYSWFCKRFIVFKRDFATIRSRIPLVRDFPTTLLVFDLLTKVSFGCNKRFTMGTCRD